MRDSRTMNSGLYLRNAEMKDIDILFCWANNPDVRKNAFHTGPISYDEHRNWFTNLMKDSNQHQYILMLQDQAVGQVRVSLTDSSDAAEIDYSIDQKYRGKGYGSVMLELLIDEIKSKHKNIVRLIGRVKHGNLASESCFEKCGFCEQYKEYEYNLAEK